MLSKEEIQKAKEDIKILRNRYLSVDYSCSLSQTNLKNIDILFKYIEELEQIKGMKESIELAGMKVTDFYKAIETGEQLKQENKKLNKMIDEMAKELDKLQDELFTKCFIPQKYSNINDCARKRSCVECIKQYFKEKVEGKLNAKN